MITALTGTLIGDDVGRAQMEVFEEIGFVTRRDLEGIRLGTGVFGGYLYSSGSLARIMGVRTPGMNASTSDEQVFGTVEGLPPYRARSGRSQPARDLEDQPVPGDCAAASRSDTA